MYKEYVTQKLCPICMVQLEGNVPASDVDGMVGPQNPRVSGYE